MLDINYNTEIDTVALQLDFDNAWKQRSVFEQLKGWIITRGLGWLNFDTNTSNKIRVHTLYCGKSKIATFSTGATTIKDCFNRNVTQYYIRIRFAGLKSYNSFTDNTSIDILIVISAFLNTSNYSYRFVELDVCIDVLCPFKNILAVCTQRTARTLYNRVGSIYKHSTSYLEYFSNSDVRKQATKRAYLYNKTLKENLSFDITRFEIKLQNGWFLHNDLDVESIINTLNRYHVMYFNDIKVKQSKIDRYNNYKKVTTREINQLEFEQYRLYPNSNVIAQFIAMVKSAYVDYYWNIQVPFLNMK